MASLMEIYESSHHFWLEKSSCSLKQNSETIRSYGFVKSVGLNVDVNFLLTKCFIQAYLYHRLISWAHNSQKKKKIKKVRHIFKIGSRPLSFILSVKILVVPPPLFALCLQLFPSPRLQFIYVVISPMRVGHCLKILCFCLHT